MRKRKLQKAFFMFLALTLIVNVMLPFSSVHAASEDNVEWEASADVPASKEWVITLNSFADPTTVTNESVYVTDGDGKKADVTVSTGKADNEVVIMPPAEGYVPGQFYTIHITNKVRDYENRPLKNAVQKTFLVKKDESASVELKDNLVELPAEGILNQESASEDFFKTPGEKSEDLVLSKDHLQDLKLGDIIVLEDSDVQGAQESRKIESIKEVDGVVVAETSIPYLEEVISSIEVNQSVPITAENIDQDSLGRNVAVSDYREYDRSTASFSEGIEYEFNKFPIEIEKEIIFITGKLRLQNPILEPYFEWNGILPDMDHLKFVLKATVITQLSFSFDGSIPLRKFDFNEVPIDLGKFATPVPQLPGLMLGGKIGGVVKVSAFGGFKSVISNTTYAEVGVIKNKKNVQPVRIFNNQTDISKSGHGGVEVKVGLRTALFASYTKIEIVSLNNDLGPYGNLKYIKGTLMSNNNQELSCTAGEVGFFHDIGVSFPPLKKLFIKSNYTFYGKKVPFLYVNDCLSVQSVAFDVNQIDIISGQTKQVKVLSNVFDLSTSFSKMENITSKVKFSSSDSAVAISSNGSIQVKEYQNNKTAVITAVYEKDGKSISTKLTVNVLKDPRLPEFGANEQTKKLDYKQSFEIVNNSNTTKRVLLDEPGDYAIYNSDGSAGSFATASKYIYIPAKGTAIVSFVNPIKELRADSEVTVKETNEAALLNMFHMKDGSSRWVNRSNKRSTIKISSGRYGYVSNKGDGRTDQFKLVDGQSSTVTLDVNGALIITAEDEAVVSAYAPSRVLDAKTHSSPALDIFELKPGEVIEAVKEGKDDYIKIAGKGKYDIVEFRNKEQKDVRRFEKGSSIYSWDSSIYMSANEVAGISNPNGTSIKVYSPRSVFTYKKTPGPLLTEYKLSPGKSLQAMNATDRLQYIKIAGKGRYDYVNYRDKETSSVGSFNKAEPIYSWDSSEPVRSNGMLVLTNPGMEDIVVYSPVSLFTYTKSEEPALESVAIPYGKTGTITNLSGNNQYIKVSGNSKVDYVTYRDRSQNNVMSFAKDESIYSWDSSFYIPTAGEMAVKNVDPDKAALIYGPASLFKYVVSEQQVLKETELSPGQSVTFNNATDRVQSVKLRGSDIYSYEVYTDNNGETVMYERENVKLYSWDSSLSLNNRQSVKITNSGTSKIIIYSPPTVFN